MLFQSIWYGDARDIKFLYCIFILVFLVMSSAWHLFLAFLCIIFSTIPSQSLISSSTFLLSCLLVLSFLITTSFLSLCSFVQRFAALLLLAFPISLLRALYASLSFFYCPSCWTLFILFPNYSFWSSSRLLASIFDMQTNICPETVIRLRATLNEILFSNTILYVDNLVFFWFYSYCFVHSLLWIATNIYS